MDATKRARAGGSHSVKLRCSQAFHQRRCGQDGKYSLMVQCKGESALISTLQHPQVQ
jgi:hypothetical protein